jgi:hypothetical protein
MRLFATGSQPKRISLIQPGQTAGEFRPEMTKRATCTQAQVRRIIKAAEREGYYVVEIKPDGTIAVSKECEIQKPSLASEREAVL